MNAMTKEGWYGPEAATFGDRIAGAREQANMNQAELARRLGVRKATLAGWEDDFSEPRANKLSMMAGLLNVSLSWLLTGEGEGPLAPGDDKPLGADLSDILTEMRDLRAQMTAASDRLGRLEKALRVTLKEQAGA